MRFLAPATILLYCTIMTQTIFSNEVDSEIKAALEKLDKEFDPCFQWWADIYDPISGGFFYSLSAKKSKKFTVNIESTSKGVNVLEWSDLLDSAPKKFKENIVIYFQKRQNKKTGFFRDPDRAHLYNSLALNRALGMSTGSIEKCGGEPLYPLPLDTEDQKAAEHYKHLNSPEELIKWLDNLPWETKLWPVGSNIRAESGLFKNLEEPKRTVLLKALEDYVNPKQKADGYFGVSREPWYSNLSGTYKIISFYDINNMKIPNLKQIEKTTFEILFAQDYDGLIVLYNTVNMLSIAQKYNGKFSKELMIKILNRCTDRLSRLHSPDGAFLTNKNETSAKSMGFTLAEKVMESNTNATGLAHKTRSLLIEMATGQAAPHPHKNGNLFLEGIKKATQ